MAIDEEKSRMAVQTLKCIIEYFDNCVFINSKNTLDLMAELPAHIAVDALNSISTLHEALESIEGVIEKAERLHVNH
jgi:hypothetical protein